MRRYLLIFLSLAVLLLDVAAPAVAMASDGRAQDGSAEPSRAAPVVSGNSSASPDTLNQVIDKVVERQHLFVAEMRHFRPMVETYIQNLQDDSQGAGRPVGDQYFLGRLQLTDRTQNPSMLAGPDLEHRLLTKLTVLYQLSFLPLGFAQMAILDDDLQRKNYDFTFSGRETLGDVHCLVLDVQPRAHGPNGRFLGKIWVEEQDYNIVRFEGTYVPRPKTGYFLHFDSWRQNLRPGVWFPVYIYSEEQPLKRGLGRELRYKAQTRLWSYEPDQQRNMEELTRIVVDSPEVDDSNDALREKSPMESQRLWETEAEENALGRLQNMGLSAPPGPVDKALFKIVDHLIVANHLVVQPPVRVRVLLLTPMLSFTIGHTIVVSRGLLDALPDEPSLAVVFAHELAHIVLGHSFDTRSGFSDRLLLSEESTFQRLDFVHPADEEDAADKKALEFLANSTYKGNLASAGSFLKAVRMRQGELKSLLCPHLDNGLANGKYITTSPLLSSAAGSSSETTPVSAAGFRIKVDPWNNRITLMTTEGSSGVAKREAFELTPTPPDLNRLSGAEASR